METNSHSEYNHSQLTLWCYTTQHKTTISSTVIIYHISEEMFYCTLIIVKYDISDAPCQSSGSYTRLLPTGLAICLFSWIHRLPPQITTPPLILTHLANYLTVPWLRLLVANLSLYRARFSLRSICVEAVVDKVALGQVFTEHFSFSPVTTIPLMLHTHSLTDSFIHHYHCYIIMATDRIITQHIKKKLSRASVSILTRSFIHSLPVLHNLGY